MDPVTVTGHLRCRDEQDAAVVRAHLAEHIALTRAEPGCVSFTVEPTEDPLVWEVAEEFRDAESFRSHQARVATGTWVRETQGIPREYVTTGL